MDLGGGMDGFMGTEVKMKMQHKTGKGRANTRVEGVWK